MTILLISGSKIAMNVISIYRINKCNYNAIDVCCKCHLIPFLLYIGRLSKQKKKVRLTSMVNLELIVYTVKVEHVLIQVTFTA